AVVGRPVHAAPYRGAGSGCNLGRQVTPRWSAATGSPDTIVVGFACLLIVGGLCSLFGIHNGFDTETRAIYLSDLRPGLEGFLFPDPARKFAALFYHLSYVLGSTLGVRG